MSRVRDLTGMRFGKLTVVSELPERHITSSGGTYVKWHCRCDCGGEIDVIGINLTSGGVKSCGCLRKTFTKKSSICDLTGRRFGRLTVMGKSPEYLLYPSGQKAVQWECKCACGNTFVTVESALLSGSVKSCGCTWKCHIK